MPQALKEMMDDVEHSLYSQPMRKDGPCTAPRRTRWRRPIASIALLIPMYAHALDDDVLGLSVFGIERYDSNLFALPDDVDPPHHGRRSARTQSSGVGLNVSKSYGLQQFNVNASLSHQHYTPYDNIDSTSHTYGASWAWTLTPSLTGNLSLNETRSPNSFADTGFQTNANPRTTQDKRFDVNYRPGAALHPRFAILQSEDTSAQTTIDRQNAETRSVEGALVYEFASGNSAEVYFRRGRGHYTDIDLIDNLTGADDSAFNEREIGLATQFTSSGLSHLNGRVGYLDRKHEAFAQRNFGGLVGSVDYDYAITGKTTLQLSVTRVLSSSQTAFSSYSDDRGVTARVNWAATGKIVVVPSFAVSQRDFRGAVTSSVQHVRMTTHEGSLRVDWFALRAVSVSAALIHTSRTANLDLFQYVNRAAQVSGTFRF